MEIIHDSKHGDWLVVQDAKIVKRCSLEQDAKDHIAFSNFKEEISKHFEKWVKDLGISFDSFRNNVKELLSNLADAKRRTQMEIEELSEGVEACCCVRDGSQSCENCLVSMEMIKELSK